MKLYIKQKVFSWGDKFNIYDEFGNDRFYVKGEVFSWGKKLRLFGLDDRELAFIRQKVFSFRYKFFIDKNGSTVAEVIKEITFFTQKYIVNGFGGWEVTGNFSAHEYEITSSTGSVARIYKKWFSWGDTYCVDIINDGDTVNVLSVVLIIDAVLALQASAAAST